MGAFVISKRIGGDFKFIFAARRGKTIFTSIACKNKSDCEQIIAAMLDNFEQFTFTRVKTAGGKYFFRLSKTGLVLANSRKFSTELMLKKGIDEVMQRLPGSEILDFSEAEPIFLDEPAEETASL